MPSYEIDASRLAATTQKKLKDLALHIVFEPAGGRVLVRTDTRLPAEAGIREIPDAEFYAAGGAPTVGAGFGPLPGAARLEASTQWKVALKSPRKANLHWVAIGGDQQALGVALAEGRGDRVELMRPIPPNLAIKGVSLAVQPRVQSTEEFAVAVVLTSGSERPWLEKGPTSVTPRTWTPLSFDFADIEEGKVGRADHLLIALITQADEGLCLIKDASLLG